mgnify:FL=1
MTFRRITITMSLALCACLAHLAAQYATGQELRRIEQPRDDGYPSYFDQQSEFRDYQPSAFRLAALEAEQVEQAPAVEGQPVYGGDYGASYGHHYGGNLAVVGGVEATFLFPILDSGNASVFVEDYFGAYNTLYATSAVSLDDEMFVSPRIWVGLQHCSGWGVNARMFRLGDSDSVFVPDTPFFLQSHFATSRLRAETFDVELTKSWCNYYGDGRNFAFGFRYANLEASELVEAHAEVNGDFAQAMGLTDRYFDGPGFTFAYGGTKATCGCCGVNLFFNFRGSFLWGDIRNAAQTTAFAFDPGVAGAATDFSTAVAETDDMTFIGEIQLGVRWQHQLQCCCARAFLSTALEYQYWHADGGLAAAGETASTDDVQLAALASAGDLELHLIGVTVGTGLVW